MIWLFLAYIAASTFVVVYLVRTVQLAAEGARAERQELEDRLMSLTEPVAMTVLEGQRQKPNGTVSYVPDEEVELDADET